MKLTYDSEVDALYLQFREIDPGAVATRDLADGVSGDFGPDGKLSGIEILDASVILGADKDRFLIELPTAVIQQRVAV